MTSTGQADRLAQADASTCRYLLVPRVREDIVAMRLRIVRQEGVIAGVQEAKEVAVDALR